MRFKVDENPPVEVSTDVIGAGHDARTVEQQRLTPTRGASLLDAFAPRAVRS